MKVLELMKVHVIRASADATLGDAVDMMDLYQVTALPIVDQEGRILGIVTERDITEWVLATGINGCKNSGGGNGSGNGVTGSTIRVGEYGSMTGSEAAFGESTHDGIMLAVAEVNKAGGVNGKQIEIVGPEDTESNTQKAE